MKYMLVFFEKQADFDKRTDPVESGAYWGAWADYCETLASSGIMVSGEGLQPPAASTIVQIKEGKRIVHDGPFAESKEMVGGFFVIDVPHLDVALDWAARSPSSSYGYTEVRPVLPPRS